MLSLPLLVASVMAGITALSQLGLEAVLANTDTDGLEKEVSNS